MASSSSADIIVIGSGVAGASIAFHLMKRNAGRVIVLDKQLAAQGGSSRSSALVRLHYTLPEEVELAVRSFQIFANWGDYVGRPSHLKQIGFVQIAPENELDLLKRNVAMQREHGANTRLISAQELREIEPDWRLDDVSHAAYEAESGYGDGSVTANDFLERAREMGAVFQPRTRVESFLVTGGRVRGVATDRGVFEAPIVISAAGPWSVPLFRAVGFELPIEPEFHRVAILKNAPGMKSGGCALIDSACLVYLRSEGEGMTLVGEFTGARGIDPDDFPQSISHDELAEIALLAARRIPALENSGVVRGVTGIYDVSPDFRPLLGETPGVEGLYMACGFSGMGYKISPLVGLTMAERILDGRAKTVDISIFDPGRFAAGRPIRAACEYADA
ncbi:MAG TPA: FAD-binding oxidoreductase [Myxococcota bacterium]|nr:FAD-binding oxidoreductase [Myxococcota bacterium]